MNRNSVFLSLALFVLTPVIGFSQEGIVKVKAVSRTVKAVTYRPKSGSTKIDFAGTPLLPNAKGEAKVESKQGSVVIEAEFEKLDPPGNLGPEFLTYVLWAITPEGRANNLGELVLNGNKSKANVTTRLQSFGLIVTAEPYFAVSNPSEVVVLENIIRKDTVGKVEEVEAKADLLQRGNYEGAKLEPLKVDPKVPLELYQARNALHIAKWQQADKYAAESYAKAEQALAQGEDYLQRKQPKKSIAMVSREAVQKAEDARVITVKRIEEERLAQERQAAAAKAKEEAEAKAATEAAEAKRKADEETRRQAELAAAREAQMKAEAEAAALKAKTEADAAAAKAKAEQDALRAKEEAAKAEAQQAQEAAMKAESDKQALRASLLEQFNRILETKDTPRGLVVTMTDVLFDTGKYNLRPEAREGLAKLSGIVLAHPGLKLEIEGHTDSTGSDELNQKLSEQRAEGVREYLIEQGLDRGSLTAKGFGKTMPIASNQSAAGRQKNRRVEMIVSGEVIGTKIGAR
jgi:outer membrane protein OmpA-like peptidoglycan-associated protein